MDNFNPFAGWGNIPQQSGGQQSFPTGAPSQPQPNPMSNPLPNASAVFQSNPWLSQYSGGQPAPPQGNPFLNFQQPQQGQQTPYPVAPQQSGSGQGFQPGAGPTGPQGSNGLPPPGYGWAPGLGIGAQPYGNGQFIAPLGQFGFNQPMQTPAQIGQDPYTPGTQAYNQMQSAQQWLNQNPLPNQGGTGPTPTPQAIQYPSAMSGVNMPMGNQNPTMQGLMQLLMPLMMQPAQLYGGRQGLPPINPMAGQMNNLLNQQLMGLSGAQNGL